MTGSSPTRAKLWTEFFLLSVASLFIELLIIRWVSADIRAFSVFKTFPLVACFIGLGVGYAAADDRLFRMTPWAMLVWVGIMKMSEAIGASYMPFPSLGIFYWHDLTLGGTQLWTRLAIGAVTLLFVLLGPFALMVCIGTRLGKLFNQFEPLPAYSVNIGGAILGSAAFTLLSFNGLSPAPLLFIASLMLLC